MTRIYPSKCIRTASVRIGSEIFPVTEFAGGGVIDYESVSQSSPTLAGVSGQVDDVPRMCGDEPREGLR